ncbi:MAG: hypothetical protein ACLS5C_10870 [Waltera sp.]
MDPKGEYRGIARVSTTELLVERQDGTVESLCRRSIGPWHLWVRVGMYSIFRDGRRRDGQPDGKTE